MAIQDKIDAANTVLSTPGDWTPEQCQAVVQGRTLARLCAAMDCFKELLDSNPADALELVNDFKASPQFAAMESLLAG